MRMNNYIVTLKPILDSIKLRYPETEAITLECEELEYEGYNKPEHVDLSSKEAVGDFAAAWILNGCGQIDFAKGGGIYIKVTAEEIKKILGDILNGLQTTIKSWTIENLTRSSDRNCLSDILEGNSGIKIVNTAESLDVLTMKQWLYSEYDRFLHDPFYDTKEWDDITIVYKIDDIISYEERIKLRSL